MSTWTANFRRGVLKRSAAYQAFIEKNEAEFRQKQKKLNWKNEQIALLNKRRAIAARGSSRADTIKAEP